jgi:hypothetical protein
MFANDKRTRPYTPEEIAEMRAHLRRYALRSYLKVFYGEIPDTPASRRAVGPWSVRLQKEIYCRGLWQTPRLRGGTTRVSELRQRQPTIRILDTSRPDRRDDAHR